MRTNNNNVSGTIPTSFRQKYICYRSAGVGIIGTDFDPGSHHMFLIYAIRILGWRPEFYTITQYGNSHTVYKYFTPDPNLKTARSRLYSQWKRWLWTREHTTPVFYLHVVQHYNRSEHYNLLHYLHLTAPFVDSNVKLIDFPLMAHLCIILTILLSSEKYF